MVQHCIMRKATVELKKRRLGRTSLMVTELGLGAMDTPQVKEGEETLHLALDMGINFIDTARQYQDSEYLIGKVIRSRGGKDFYMTSRRPKPGNKFPRLLTCSRNILGAPTSVRDPKIDRFAN